MQIEFFPAPFLLGCTILVILMAFVWRRQRSASYLVCFALFGLYLLILVGVTIFPLPDPAYLPSLEWRQNNAEILSRINLTPFNFGGLFMLNPNVIYHEIADNILMTMPFGFGICFLTAVQAKTIPWLALGVGLATESAQLFISFLLGVTYRSVDINDVILNALGVLIGYVIFRLFAWIYLKGIHRMKVNAKGFFAFVESIADRAPQG